MDPIGRPRSVAAKIVPDTTAVVVASKSDGTKYIRAGAKTDYRQIDVEHVDEESEERPPYGMFCSRVEALRLPVCCGSHAAPPSTLPPWLFFHFVASAATHESRQRRFKPGT
jgi:hypothetical protein